MIVDEMELVSRLKDVEPLRPEAFEQARTVLRAAMAVDGSEATSIRVRRHLRRRRAQGLRTFDSDRRPHPGGNRQQALLTLMRARRAADDRQPGARAWRNGTGAESHVSRRN